MDLDPISKPTARLKWRRCPLTRKGFFLFFTFFTFLTSCNPNEASIRFAVYYGQDVTARRIAKFDLVIFEPDQLEVSSFKNLKTKLIAYLSVGEIEKTRYYWRSFESSLALVDENPHWKGSYRIDIRNKKWRDFLIRERIPQILARGFDGLFLDTVDTARYLEEKDPKKFEGSIKAMIDFVFQIRDQFPDLILIPNNGLEMLGDYGSAINAVVVEDLYTRFDFETAKSIKTPHDDSLYKEALLDAFVARYQKPVLNILYAPSKKDPVGFYGIEKSRQKGYPWYLTSVDLMQWGEVSK